jgi:hypothetical protein
MTNNTNLMICFDCDREYTSIDDAMREGHAVMLDDEKLLIIARGCEGFDQSRISYRAAMRNR